MKRIVVNLVCFIAFSLFTIMDVGAEVICKGTIYPGESQQYLVLCVYGRDGNMGSMRIADEEGNEYDIAMYSGYTGAVTYYWVTPGTYKVVDVGYSGSYVTLRNFGNLEKGYTLRLESRFEMPDGMLHLVYG